MCVSQYVCCVAEYVTICVLCYIMLQCVLYYRVCYNVCCITKYVTVCVCVVCYIICYNVCVVLQSLKAEFEQQQAILDNLEKLAADYKAQGKAEAGARLEQQSSLLRVSRAIVTLFWGE